MIEKKNKIKKTIYLYIQIIRIAFSNILENRFENVSSCVNSSFCTTVFVHPRVRNLVFSQLGCISSANAFASLPESCVTIRHVFAKF